MKKLLSILSLACAAIYGGDCLAITATKEYVDRRDATLISKPATTVPAGYVLVKGAASNETAWVENTGAGMSSNQVVSIASSAAVTNAGAVASAKNYTDTSTLAATNFVKAGYLPLAGGTVKGSLKLSENSGTSLQIGDAGDGTAGSCTSPREVKFTSYGNIYMRQYENPTVDKILCLPFEDGEIATKEYVTSSCQTNLVVDISTADKVLTNDGTTLYWGEGGGGGPTGGVSKAYVDAHDLATLNSAKTNTAAIANALDVSHRSLMSQLSQAATNYTDVSTLAATNFVKSGYLPLAGGTMTGEMSFPYNTGISFNSDNRIYSWANSMISFQSAGSGSVMVSNLEPDDTDIMTEGKADYHIVSNATVTSGQIANVNLTGLTNKTVVINFSSTTTKAGDALLWTGGNTADCTMTFSVTPNTLVPHGDDGYLKATANKKCLFLFDKVSATDIIITKKEFD